MASESGQKLQIWSSSILSNSGVLHFFTTRKGGVSGPPFDSLNLGLTTRDLPERVLENRRIVEAEYGVKLSALAWQVHGEKVLVIRKEDPLPAEPDLPKADAVIGNVPGLCIAMFFADCVPIYIWDPVRKVGGLAHAGWRSTLGEIGARGVEAMAREFGSSPEDMQAAIGPSIGPCCFEVKADVEKPFVEKFGERVRVARGGKTYLNLWEANVSTLKKKGVKTENIDAPGICTACDADRFFSYRRDKGETGRMAGLIKL